MRFIKKIWENRWLLAVTAFVLGAFTLVAVRFVTYDSDNIHYHANFALYVNGERDEFESFTFYEEVQACVAEGEDNPKNRVHMHNQKNDVVHVHNSGVTWGNFFENLGYTLGDKVVRTNSGVYADGEDGNELAFVLNGETVSSVANRVIGDEDRLLINYGDDSAESLQERFDAIAGNAGEYNSKHDPGGCAGDEELTFAERLRRAIGIGGVVTSGQPVGLHSH